MLLLSLLLLLVLWVFMSSLISFLMFVIFMLAFLHHLVLCFLFAGFLVTAVVVADAVVILADVFLCNYQLATCC